MVRRRKWDRPGASSDDRRARIPEPGQGSSNRARTSVRVESLVAASFSAADGDPVNHRHAAEGLHLRQAEQRVVERAKEIDERAPSERGVFVIHVREDGPGRPAQAGEMPLLQTADVLRNDAEVVGLERALTGSGLGVQWYQ